MSSPALTLPFISYTLHKMMGSWLKHSPLLSCLRFAWCRLFQIICVCISCIAMPRGVYDRIPGKKNKGTSSGGFPARKIDKNSFNKRPNNGGTVPNLGKRGPSNQLKGIWIKQLADMGYDAIGRAPNRAVQSLLCLIPTQEVHQLILRLNRGLPPNAYSPVIYLGFSGWLDLFLKMDSVGMKANECESILQQIFADILGILADRTDLDDMLALECKAGVAYLEKANSLKDKTFGSSPTPDANNSGGENTTSQSFVKFIPKEDLDIMARDRNKIQVTQTTNSNDSMVRLTLHNCIRFPIISEMAIEWLGEEFDQGLWRSPNSSTLAPISRQAWIHIAGLTNEQLVEIDDAARNMIKLIDKEEVTFPFNTSLFDKIVKIIWGLLCLSKLIWPTHKWLDNTTMCTEYGGHTVHISNVIAWTQTNARTQLLGSTKPSGLHAIILMWYTLNCPLLAHLVFLQIRDMMVRILNKLVVDPNCDISAEFGSSKMVEVCEMMLKEKAFLLKKLNIVNNNENCQSTQTHVSNERYVDFMPPRVSRGTSSSSGMVSGSSCQLIERITDGSDSIVFATNEGASVTKGPRPGNNDRSGSMMQAKLTY